MSNSSITLTSLANTLGISSLIEDTTPDIAADYLMSYGTSASGNKKVLIKNSKTWAWNYISTATASNSATINFTGLTSLYSCYYVLIQNYIPSTDATDLWLRTSTDGGANYDAGANTYKYSGMHQIDSALASLSLTADTKIKLNVGTATFGTNTSEIMNGWVTIFSPSLASRCWVRVQIAELDSAGKFTKHLPEGYRDTAADVDAIQFLSSSGNIASGTFTLYGIK